MKHHDPHPSQKHDKQLQGISLEAVMEKRRLDQALSAKEFSVCAGVSYSTARHWFHLPGFPVFHGVVFWNDFTLWRVDHQRLDHPPGTESKENMIIASTGLPPRAEKLLLDS